jgi:hypothetical protein
MARIIRLKYAAQCGECSKKLPAGTEAQYGGPGAISCVGCRPLAAVKTRYGRRVYGGQAHTGSRCEDAPCCGCCG